MKILKAIFTAALLLTSGLSLAGKSSSVPVEVSTVDSWARGSMTTARFSDNLIESIGCGIRTYAEDVDGVVSESVTGFCQANTSTSTYRICYTTNPKLLDQINSISDYSYILFVWNDLGDCTYISTSTQSFYIP